MNRIKRHTLKLMGALAVMLVLWVSFGGRGDDPSNDIGSAPLQVEKNGKTDTEITKDTGIAGETLPLEHSEVLALLSTSDTIKKQNRFEAHFDSMPGGGVKMKINYLGGSLRRVFNDSNYLHINTAERIGVRPVRSIRDAWEAGAALERLNSCAAYYLDNLTHSLPYLVPEAHKLLADIGMAFRDSLKARGGGDYRIKVTSVLRTPRLVKRLRRRNRNAVDTSAHLYGTTFDISYAKFICDSVTTPRTQEDMKNLLGEVVFAMRQQGRCYVKYEHKQACFHITARK